MNTYPEAPAILREAATFLNGLPDAIKETHHLRSPLMDELEGFAYMMEDDLAEEPPLERKEPWASCITVATNRAIRRFREEWPIVEGTRTAAMSNDDGDTNFIRVVGLATGTTSDYSFESLGIEIEDLFTP